MFMGISVIWDKQFGFMKEILVAPISRLSIYIGKMLGVGTSSMIQGIIVLFLGFLIGIPLSLVMCAEIIPMMILITVGVVCIGLVIASVLNSLENFGAIVTFVNMPMFFLSGALFPVATLPSWLKWVFYINPLTYSVDALRAITMGSQWTTIFPLWVGHFNHRRLRRGHDRHRQLPVQQDQITGMSQSTHPPVPEADDFRTFF